MPSTHKKVIVRKADRDTVNGFVASSHFVRDGKFELLNTSGNVVAIDLTDIKCVFFVREFGDSDSLSRKTFTTRPRSEGLWVRIKFKDGEVLDGLMPNDLSLTNFVHSDFTMLNGRLARHYGIPGVSGQELKKVTLPKDSHRGGVLTMAGVLKVTANP